MPLHILSDNDVNKILHSFKKEDILELQESLADALHEYSNGSDSQPERTVLKRKDGSTTLFMPASGIAGQGVKVVNVVAPDTSGLPSLANQAPDEDLQNPFHSTDRPDSLDTTQPAGEISNNPSNPSLPSRPEPTPNPTSTIKGSITLMDGAGNTTGLINAEEVTAFRTALASTLLLPHRHAVHNITIFGAGKQAYWHARLALLLRGPEIQHLTLITRNPATAQKCLTRLQTPFPTTDPTTFDDPLTRTMTTTSTTKQSILTPDHTEYPRLLEATVRSSAVIFCCTPSHTPLFPARYLTDPEAARFIACIGSYQPHMVELHPDLLRAAVAPCRDGQHQRGRREGGAVLVDTAMGCLREAGEVIQAGLGMDQVVEVGELVVLRRDGEEEEEGEEKKGKGVGVGGCRLRDDSGLREWLTEGNVIYKSVGVGLMDLVVGNELIRFGRARGIGTTIEDF
jgi:ornithine cyclodeaminase/alanine dehydrogenase-like protein (mu-crystallin family)